MKSILSDGERDSIEKAVLAAETHTSGEIVPYIVRRSGRYREVVWKAGILFGIIAILIVYGMSAFYNGWSYGWLFASAGGATIILSSACLGAALANYVPAVERLLLSDDSISSAVTNRAAAAFIEEEVFKTENRTGILIFVSLFEHRVEVVGDTTINGHVEPQDWAHVVEDILLGIKEGSLAAGLIRGIERCGTLLETSGVEIQVDDENELTNRVRLRDS